MERKEKAELRDFIGRFIDLSGVRLKDDEAEELARYCYDSGEWNGLSETRSSKHTGWCSDGKYEREERSTYTICAGDEAFSIEERYECHDDDGYTDSANISHTNARDILSLMGSIFARKEK